MSIAIITTGAKQYKVKVGDKVKVEKLSGEIGQGVKFDTLMVTDPNGSSLEVGKPVLERQVEGKILQQGRNNKVLVVKYKNKTRYKRTYGHRQPFTEIEITKV